MSAFDARAWHGDFAAIGGEITIKPNGRLRAIIDVDAPGFDPDRCGVLLRDVAGKPDRLAAVKFHLRGRP